MKQTAVELYEKEINYLLEKYEAKLISKIEFITMKHNLFYGIKEIEKEQIIDSYTTGLIDPLIMKNYKGLSVDEIRIELKKQAGKYYNETYKNETK